MIIGRDKWKVEMVLEVENGKNKANEARMVVIWLNGGSNIAWLFVYG